MKVMKHLVELMKMASEPEEKMAANSQLDSFNSVSRI